MDKHEIKVVETMEKFGGSFVRALAGCFWHADRTNFEILKSSFNHYWKQYENWDKK